MISDFFNEILIIQTKTELQTNGKLERVWVALDKTYWGGFFNPSTAKTVRWGKQDFVISLNLYCPIDTPINLGDRIVRGTTEYDVIYKENTNDRDHHLSIGLASR